MNKQRSGLCNLTMVSVCLGLVLSSCSSSGSETADPTKGTVTEVRGTIAEKYWDNDHDTIIWINEGRLVNGYTVDPPIKRQVWGNARVGDNVTLELVTPDDGAPVISDVNGIIAAQEQEKKDHGDQKN